MANCISPGNHQRGCGTHHFLIHYSASPVCFPSSFYFPLFWGDLGDSSAHPTLFHKTRTSHSGGRVKSESKWRWDESCMRLNSKLNQLLHHLPHSNVTKKKNSYLWYNCMFLKLNSCQWPQLYWEAPDLLQQHITDINCPLMNQLPFLILFLMFFLSLNTCRIYLYYFQIFSYIFQTGEDNHWLNGV